MYITSVSMLNIYKVYLPLRCMLKSFVEEITTKLYNTISGNELA